MLMDRHRSCNARLVIQRSSTPCTVNATFGCDASGDHGTSIWVDGGCRGRFDCGGGRSTNCGEQYYSRRRWTCACRTPDNESRSMPSLLRREDRSALGAHRGPIVVITHTHTMRSRAALILAREQLSLHSSHLFHAHEFYSLLFPLQLPGSCANNNYRGNDLHIDLLISKSKLFLMFM